MSDFGTNKYHEMYDHANYSVEVNKESRWSCLTIIFTILSFAFVAAMFVMMMQMVHILKDMDRLMERTTSNTYAMCELTKKISFDNATICLN